MTQPRDARVAAGFAYATVFIDAMGFGIIMPVLPTFVMTLGHVDLAAATRIGGWLGVIYAVVQFLAGPLIGNLGDRFGRRPVLLGTLAGFAAVYALMGFAPSLAWLFASRALAGFFGAAAGPAGATLADISAPEDRARLFGLMGAAGSIGFIAGPAIGGILGEVGLRAPFYAAAALAGANLLLGLLFFPETLSTERRRPFRWQRANPLGAFFHMGRIHGVAPLLFALFAFAFAQMIYPSIWAFFTMSALGWTPGLIGASLAWVGVMTGVWQTLLIGPLIRRLGEPRTAIFGIAMAGLGFVAFAFARSTALTLFIQTVSSLQSVTSAALQGMLSRRVAADAQGELQGVNGSILAIASILAPAIYNPILAAFTSGPPAERFPGAPFLLGAAACAVGITILVGFMRRPQVVPGS